MWYNYRLLTPNEKLQAVQVFDNTLPWNDIYIADGYLPANNGVPVTVMTQIERPKYSNKFHKDYTIYWGQIVYNNGADSLTYRDTLIHELTHVWQGHNEGQVIFNYMIRSLVSQSWAIATHFDRGKAYNYDTKNYLKWSDYNVEQQANIVEQWFSFDSNNNGGSLSVFDPRLCLY